MTETMIKLAGTWNLADDRGEHTATVNFPGDIHAALLHAGIIPDPFIGQNEREVQWVGARGWRAWRTFEVDAPEGTDRWLLEIGAVDTVAEIFLNGELAGRSSNMFVPLRLDVGDSLIPGSNTIEVRFDSPEAAAADRAARLPYEVPHQIYPFQSMHRNVLRKVQCHSSWDWGIALMVSGLYGGLGIRGVGEEALVTAYGIPRKDGAGWTVPVHVEWDRQNAPVGARELPSAFPDTTVQVDLYGPDGELVRTVPAEEGAADVHLARPGELIVDVPVAAPELWWPAGYGTQPRYAVTVRFGSETHSFSTAFRTVEVVSEEDDTGRSMFFRVNGRDIWAKGANWIPVDAFPSRHTPERYRDLLLDAVDANMNMIRVWGGGQYEDNVFYDTCDELGILVWQDFMFSCSLYPSESWFLAEVREEVRAQLRRLVSHPSVALWCGNNENIGALGWFDVSIANPGRYLIDFDRLNHGVIATEVRAFDNTRVFWPSSPAAGEGDFSDNWHDDSAGDMHYWSVWHEGKPFHAYYDVTPRFCSEFGFQSFPGLVTLGQFAAPDQFNPTAPDMEHHQRNPRGNTVILETMSRYFRVPFTFADFVYLSQVQQAMAIGMAVEYWRSRRPVSMGALYWQLNDLWPVVSWSSIEYDGRWKLLHYAARRFFSPLRVVLIHRDGRVSAHLLNDTVEPVSGVLRIRGIDWTGTEAWHHEEPVHAAAEAGTELWSAVASELPFEPGDAFLLAEVRSPDGVVLDRDEQVLVPYKHAPLEVPSILVTPSGPRSITVTCADAPAFWVTLGTEDARFQPEDNGFFMLPGERREIELTPIRGRAAPESAHTSQALETPASPSTLNVTVRTIRDTY